VAEQIVEIVEARPGDARQAERAGLVRGQKQAVPGIGALVGGQFKEALDGVHFPMPERVLDLVVGFGNQH
jgi:hypothetical protein